MYLVLVIYARLTRALNDSVVALVVLYGSLHTQRCTAGYPSRRQYRTFLFSQHEQNRYVCAPGSLLPIGYCTGTGLASLCVLTSHRLELEPKLRCMRSILYWRQGPLGGALFLVKGLSQGPRSGALLYVRDCS